MVSERYQDLRNAVFDALDNVSEGGYHEQLAAMTDEEQAVDLLDKCADVEGASLDDVIQAVSEWRRLR